MIMEGSTSEIFIEQRSCAKFCSKKEFKADECLKRHVVVLESHNGQEKIYLASKIKEIR